MKKSDNVIIAMICAFHVFVFSILLHFLEVQSPIPIAVAWCMGGVGLALLVDWVKREREDRRE